MKTFFKTIIVRIDTSLIDVNPASTVIRSECELVRIGDVLVMCDNVPHDGAPLPTGEHTLELARLARWMRLASRLNVAVCRWRSRSFVPYEQL